jgi:3-oxoacyl-[acyl-carrier-protein] synthase III
MVDQLHAVIDAPSLKYLRNKYAIVGVGETAYMRGSGTTTRALGTWAVRNAIADAGLKPADIDGVLSYHFVLGDSTYVPFIAGDLGIRADFYMDVQGGGASTKTLVGVAMWLIEAGMCKVVVIYVR